MTVDTFPLSASDMNRNLFSYRGFTEKSIHIAVYNYYTAELKSHCRSKIGEEYWLAMSNCRISRVTFQVRIANIKNFSAS